LSYKWHDFILLFGWVIFHCIHIHIYLYVYVMYTCVCTYVIHIPMSEWIKITLYTWDMHDIYFSLCFHWLLGTSADSVV
jgi:hypothetical protein